MANEKIEKFTIWHRNGGFGTTFETTRSQAIKRVNIANSDLNNTGHVLYAKKPGYNVDITP